MATGYRSTTNYRASIPYQGVAVGGDGTASWTGTIIAIAVAGFTAVGAASAAWAGSTVATSVSGFEAVFGPVANWTGPTITTEVSGFTVASDSVASWIGSTVTTSVSGFGFRRPETVNLWTRARRMLDRGLEKLQFELPTPFTVGHLGARQFIGSIEEANFGNNLGAGGFIPEAGGTLYVRRAVFAAANLSPWPGMKLSVQVTGPDGLISERRFVVTDVGVNEHRWRLTLLQGQPKAPDVPDRSQLVSFN